MNAPRDPGIEVLNPAVGLGRFRHALFDFDGTLSVIREGWERVMVPLMVEMIAGESGDPDGSVIVLRSFWSNQASMLVNDVPGEIMLHPDLWGGVAFEGR